MEHKQRKFEYVEIGTSEESFELKASKISCSIVAFAFFLFGLLALYIPYKIALIDIRRKDSMKPFTLLDANSRPNIVFILTDDQGMGDMDLTGNDVENLMPFIRNINSAGLNFTSHYVSTRCTPTRASLLTGRYSINNGMYHSVIGGTQPWGLPLSQTLLPEYFLQAGYGSTYHLGKWHLGHYSEGHLPTNRGFNHSLGFYGGFQHPKKYHYEWNHEVSSIGALIPDMHLNGVKFEAIPDEIADYHNSYLITDEAERIIASEGVLAAERAASGETNSPFFMLFSPPLIHMPLIPDDTVMDVHSEDLKHISDNWRRKCMAMLIMLDNITGRIMKALDTAQVLDNTIVIFTSDNGAHCTGSHAGAGSNFPLRGCKGSLYEGGVRVPAFMFSHLMGHRVGRPGAQLTSMFHVTDWLPTLIGGMLGQSSLLPSDLDGVNQWDWLLSAVELGTTDSSIILRSSTKTDLLFARDDVPTAPRTSFLYNADAVTGIAALRRDSFKLTINESTDVGWHSPANWGSETCQSLDNYTNSVQLFDLDRDPEERSDLSAYFPDMVRSMRSEIMKYIEDASPPSACEFDDDDVIDIWQELNTIQPWIVLNVTVTTTINSNDYSNSTSRMRRRLRTASDKRNRDRKMSVSSATTTTTADYICPLKTFTQSSCGTV